jgi:hypothetical protein
MLRTAERDIGGKRYQITELAAVHGRAMLVRLMRLLGPSMAAMLRSLDLSKGLGLANVTGDNLADAVTDLCAKLDAHEFEEICTIFLERSEVYNSETGGYAKLQKAFAFSGDYGSLFKLLAFHVEHNFASFFEGLGITAPRS